MLRQIAFWLKNARAGSLPVSTMPAFVAFSVAFGSAGFDFFLGVLAIIGVAFCHLSINLLDDYFDYKKKSAHVRDELVHRGVRARVGKCEYIVSGEVSLNKLKKVILGLTIIGMLCGGVVFAFRGIVILYIVLTTIILGYSYSGGILKLSYRGLGNIVMWIMSGPLLMIGVYYSATGMISSTILFLSVPVGLLAANNTFVHDIMDCEPDKEVGRVTLATIISNKYILILSLAGILAIVYGVIIAGAILQSISLFYLFVLLTLPMAISLMILMVAFIQTPNREYLPRFWMGPMIKRQAFLDSGIGWFLIRWFLARNLMMFFCIILVVVSFII